jgi:hypothetical protein
MSGDPFETGFLIRSGMTKRVVAGQVAESYRSSAMSGDPFETGFLIRSGMTEREVVGQVRNDEAGDC